MRHKVRSKLAAVLCMVMLMVMALGSVVNADEIDAATEDTTVEDATPEEATPEGTPTEEGTKEEAAPNAETEVLPQGTPAASETEAPPVNEADQSDEIITNMDLEGNVTEAVVENGYLEGDLSMYQRTAAPQIVNFNTRGNDVTSYTECGTGAEGYTNGMYGADAAYLGTEGGKVKFMLAGVIGLVDPGLVQIVNVDHASSVSYYTVSGGRLLHYITTNIGKGSYSSVLDNGPAPSYLGEGGVYYSYDGHYFYTRDQFGSMLDNYKAGTRANAVNGSNPYYNYFQYLPMRSKTSYSDAQLNSIIDQKAANSSSKMLNTGSSFISRQNTYGVNAILAVGLAANESWWGKSQIAQQKNNLFGLNAVDHAPGTSADTYPSVDSCITTFAETYMSKQYLNPDNWVYSGGFLGNKASGMNVEYASDPYWGEKNANVAWMIDKAYGNQDVYAYTIGIKDVIGTEHTNLNVRSEASTSSTVIHETGKYSNQAFLVLDGTGNNGFYKIQSDPALNSNRTGIASGGEYNYGNMYSYVSSQYVRIASNGNGGGSSGNNYDQPPVPVPSQVENAITYETHVADIGWQEAASNGYMAGTTGKNLSMEAIKIKTNGIANLGVSYSAHVQDIGWQNAVSDGGESGTTGQAKKIEALRIELTGSAAPNYDLYYRAHVSEFGWLDWAKNGELAGTQAYNYALQAIQIVLVPKGTAAPGSVLTPFRINTVRIEYASHVQDIGWQDSVANGELSGTTGQNKKIEALAVAMKASNLGVKYKVSVQDQGWQGYQTDGWIAGTVGQNRRLEAIAIELTGSAAKNYDLYYRVHVQDLGWLDWAKNGNSAGTQGYGLKVEGIQVLIMPKGNPQMGQMKQSFLEKSAGVVYSAHVQDIGWQNSVQSEQTAGTTGQNKQIEAVKIRLDAQTTSGAIKYKTHVQDIGWQNAVTNDAVAGTVGQNKQVEAICIELTGEMAKQYDVYYRIHASDFGWLGWAKNGEKAGSEGYNRQAEAIEITLVKKGASAPGSTSNCFHKK